MPKSLASALPLLLVLAACGGGGGPQVIATPGPPNVESVVVDSGPAGINPPVVNTVFVTVNVCVPPGFTTCQTIDHVQVDTGSVGLRVISAALNPAILAGLQSTPVTDNGQANGVPLAECLAFADGTSIWGPLAVANISFPVSGEQASNVTVQVIDANAPGDNTQPAGCGGSPINTVDLFGANGILGVGPFINDCNSFGACTPGTQAANYYRCPTTTSCAAYSVGASLVQQLPNPVVLFATDNTGTILELPPAAANGSAVLDGSLVFGIGTQSNNGIGTATPLAGDPSSGFITATLNGNQLPNSYLDSGSTGNIFVSSIPACTGGLSTFYCPNNTTAVNATLQGSNGTAAAANFSVANAQALFTSDPSAAAFSTLAGPGSDPSSLDLGLSFFFGRNIYTGIENTQSNAPPYYAY